MISNVLWEFIKIGKFSELLAWYKLHDNSAGVSFFLKGNEVKLNDFRKIPMLFARPCLRGGRNGFSFQPFFFEIIQQLFYREKYSRYSICIYKTLHSIRTYFF